MVIAAGLAVAIAGCGFHLRGSGGTAVLPASLSSLRIVSEGLGENHPLTMAVEQALAAAGATVTDAKEAPVLVLSDERVSTRVAAVSGTTAKASEYLLQYSVTFRLEDAEPTAPQTLRLQRDFSFDAEQVLAREQQERELLEQMRQEAAQQILRRLARARTPRAR